MIEALTHWWVYALFVIMAAPAATLALRAITGTQLPSQCRMLRAWLATAVLAVAAGLPYGFVDLDLTTARVAQGVGYLGGILTVAAMIPAMHLMANHVTAPADRTGGVTDLVPAPVPSEEVAA